MGDSGPKGKIVVVMAEDPGVTVAVANAPDSEAPTGVMRV